MKKTIQVKSLKRRGISHSIKKVSDTTVIKKHMLSLDNEAIKKALILSGMYDNNMKLTASFR